MPRNDDDKDKPEVEGNAGGSGPLVRLEDGASAPVLSYNVPDPTSYSGRSYIRLELDATPEQLASRGPVFKPIPGSALPSPRLARRDGEGGGPVASAEPFVEVSLNGVDNQSTINGPAAGAVFNLRVSSRSTGVPRPVVRSGGVQVTLPNGASADVAGTPEPNNPTAFTVSYTATENGTYQFRAFAMSGSERYDAMARAVNVVLAPGVPPAAFTIDGLPGTVTLDEHDKAKIKVTGTCTSIKSARITSDSGTVVTSADLTGKNTWEIEVELVGEGDRTLFIQALADGDKEVSSSTRTVHCSPPESVEGFQQLVLIECYELSNFLGAYGAGRAVATFSLLPGEKTTITVRTFNSTETSAKQAAAIMEGYEQTASDDFATAIEKEQGQRSQDNKSFAASASLEASASYGVASAKISASISASTASAREQTSRNVSNATQKHAAAKSSKRQINATNETEAKKRTENESTVVRVIENPNLSRTLNIIFRQMNQEYISLLHLTDVRIGYLRTRVKSDPEVKGPDGEPLKLIMEDLPLAELNALLERVVSESWRDEVRSNLLLALDTVTDYKGTVLPAMEEVELYRPVRDAAGHLVYEGDGEDRKLKMEAQPFRYPRFWQRESVYSDGRNTFTVPGIITGMTRTTLRTDAMIAEAILGQGDALDNYTQALQNQTADGRRLDNELKQAELERAALARSIVSEATPAKRAEVWGKVYPAPVVVDDDHQPA